MRFCLALLLAFVIPFNAACAAGIGICDVLEGRAPHGEHLGHHEHAHHCGQEVGGDSDPAQPAADHNHFHEHPVFSWMLNAPVDIAPPPNGAVVLPLPPSRFASAIPPRPERPPRHVLVA
jgi:hypothetical protein